jgi:DNA-binding NarL/FixJ family response regulator
MSNIDHVWISVATDLSLFTRALTGNNFLFILHFPPNLTKPPTFVKPRSFSPMNKLNYREIQLINYSAQGYTAKEVARLTGLESRTIEAYMNTIRKKLNAKNIAHAIYIACEKEVITGKMSAF